MLFKTILVSALAATTSAAVITRNGGGDGSCTSPSAPHSTPPSTPPTSPPTGPTHPTPASCSTRDDGKTSPMYCPDLGGLGITIPVQLCNLGLLAGLNVLSCCGPSSCIGIDIL